MAVLDVAALVFAVVVVAADLEFAVLEPFEVSALMIDPALGQLLVFA